MQLKMCPRACPVCGSTDTSQVFAEEDFDPEAWGSLAFASRKPPEYMHYRLISCRTCDLLYANPVPDLPTLAHAYDEAAFDSGEEAAFAAHTYASFLPGICKSLPDLKGALDIGTGDGAFMEELLKHNFTDVAGVEPSAAPIAAAKEHIRPLIRHALFRPDDFSEERFRLITCFQTIEHLYEPLAVCRDAYGLLKEQGALFLICHNRKGFVNRALKFKSPIMDIEHLQLFSPQSAQRLLSEAGFKNIVVKPVINRYPLRYWMRLFPWPKSMKDKIVKNVAQSKLGSLPVALPVGNLAVIGYKV